MFKDVFHTHRSWVWCPCLEWFFGISRWTLSQQKLRCWNYPTAKTAWS